jgi:1-acyl-sn-glycerol-3-phosphate acyltransferase
MHDPATLRHHSYRRARLLRRLLDLVFGAITRREVHGLENLPAAGRYILVFNHLSNFDPHLIFTQVRRPDCVGLVAASYRGNVFARFLVESTGGIWLRRGEGDRATLRTALTLLEAGWMIGIAPEGGRTRTGGLGEGRPGAAFLATRTSSPIVPVAVTNTEKVSRSLLRLRRTPVTITIGKPFLLPPLIGTHHKEQLRAATDTVMCHISALLPPRYRGVYAEHPGLEMLPAEVAEVLS